MSALKQHITEDMKTAMRAKDTARLSTIRLLLAAIKQKEVDERVELDDAAVVSVVDKLLKQRKDSIAAYEQAGRTDLADIEKAEAAVLQTYLPERMSAEGRRVTPVVVRRDGRWEVSPRDIVAGEGREWVAGFFEVAAGGCGRGSLDCGAALSRMLHD